MKILSVSFFLALLLASIPAFALDFDFSGEFLFDNDVAMFDFTVGAPSTVTLFSSSWLDPDGVGPLLGGFDPILAIWDSSGDLIVQQDDGGNIGSTLSNGVLYDHGVWDSYFSQLLGTGSYTASIAQYANFSVSSSLADGFVFDADPYFTTAYGSAPLFNGVSGDEDPRTGNWAFHILNVDDAGIVDDVAPVPEPSTLLLLGSGLVGLFYYGRKRKKV